MPFLDGWRRKLRRSTASCAGAGSSPSRMRAPSTARSHGVQIGVTAASDPVQKYCWGLRCDAHLLQRATRSREKMLKHPTAIARLMPRVTPTVRVSVAIAVAHRLGGYAACSARWLSSRLTRRWLNSPHASTDAGGRRNRGRPLLLNEQCKQQVDDYHYGNAAEVCLHCSDP